MSSSEVVNVPFFKKKRSRPTTARQRSASPEVGSGSGPMTLSSKTTVVLPTRKAGGNLLTAGTKRTASQREDGAEHEDVRREGVSVNWGAAGSHIDAARDILAGDEAEAILTKRRRAETGEPEPVADDGMYHGQKAYTSHVRKNQEVPKAMRTGPQRASGSTIRTVTIVDYQPDVCKDYKETGFCGFGDTCKFLHDRGTYLAGWQLDKLAVNPSNVNEDTSDESDSDDEDVPFACLICRKPYTEPVMTRCGHYFCSACAIKRFARNPKCVACGASTGGIFNRADKILDKIKKRQDKHKSSDAEEVGNAAGGGDDGVRIEGLVDSGERGSRSEDEDSDGD